MPNERYCTPCGETYHGYTIHCCRCGSADTYPTYMKPTTGVCTVCGGPRAALCSCVETDFDPKTQQALFTVPAPPKPNLWRIETRWKEASRVRWIPDRPDG